jgi:hypothetical protein
MLWRHFASIAAAILTIGTAHAATSTPCEDLRGLKMASVIRVEADAVAAGTFTPENKQAPLIGGVLPAFCRVRIVIAPQIKVEVWLPAKNWNERFHGRGIGGTGGFIAHQYLADSLREGYATATTDTGHDASDLNWGSNPDGSTNMSALSDYGWRSVHEMTLKAKQTIAAYYGRPSQYNYFSGCSGGGRQGLTEVQRFPADYDGVLAGCTPMAFNRELATFLWPQVVMRERLGRPISVDKLHALSEAVVKACDGNDGIVDGIVNDPRKCDYDPAQLSCDRKASTATCLTAKEADVVRAIWEGPKSRTTGERIWFTAEKTVYAAPWDKPYPIGVELVKWVTGNPRADWTTLTENNFEDYVNSAIAKLSHAFDADNPRIDKYIDRGGKLLMWHGEADWGDPSRDTINYYSRILASNTASQGTADAVRLFLLPGIGHCAVDWSNWKASAAPYPSAKPVLQTGAAFPDAPLPGFPFPDRLFNALVAWVERGTPPERVIASQQLPDGRVRTRPLCAFPKTAKWNGVNDTDTADSFACADGGHDMSDFTTMFDHR